MTEDAPQDPTGPGSDAPPRHLRPMPPGLFSRVRVVGGWVWLCSPLILIIALVVALVWP